MALFTTLRFNISFRGTPEPTGGKPEEFPFGSAAEYLHNPAPTSYTAYIPSKVKGVHKKMRSPKIIGTILTPIQKVPGFCYIYTKMFMP